MYYHLSPGSRSDFLWVKRQGITSKTSQIKLMVVFAGEQGESGPNFVSEETEKNCHLENKGRTFDFFLNCPAVLPLEPNDQISGMGNWQILYYLSFTLIYFILRSWFQESVCTLIFL